MTTSIGTRQLGALALRILGVIWLLRAIAHFRAFMGLFAPKPPLSDSGNFGFVIGATVVSFLVTLLIAWLLLAKAGRVAERLFPDEGTVGIALSAEECLAVALAVVGIWVVIDSIPRLGEAIMNFKFMADSGRVYVTDSWVKSNEVVLAGAVAQLVVGIGLFVKSRYLASRWSSLDGGQSESEPGESHDDATP